MGRDAHAVAIVVCDGVTIFELGVACDVFAKRIRSPSDRRSPNW
jgi:hypothetical protein